MKGTAVSAFINTLIDQAKKDKQTIVLPEGNDERVLTAAEEVLKQDIADLIIIGNPDEIAASGHDLTGAQIVDPLTSPDLEDFANLLYDLRKAKGMTLEEAQELVKDPIHHAVMMVKTGKADGLVGGASCATIKILSPSLRILKTAPGAPMVTSFFIMNVPNCDLGDNGTFLFADCALCIQPTSEDLAHLASLALLYFPIHHIVQLKMMILTKLCTPWKSSKKSILISTQMASCNLMLPSFLRLVSQKHLAPLLLAKQMF